MRAHLAWLAFGAALASCSSQADKQLAAVKSSRSVLAEWALAERQGAQGRVTATYLAQMREHARDELKSAQRRLPKKAAAALVPLLETPPDAASLERADAALAPMEKQLESS